jgi:hypothetical protein
MTSMTSRSLRWAREDRDKADKILRTHRNGCTQCRRAHIFRNNDRCSEGNALAIKAQEAAEKVRAEQRAAAGVPAGQLELF